MHPMHFLYVGFEDRFRGSEEQIRERLKDYVAYFAGQSDVLDVGCGRGEFLELLREKGVRARGLDLNPEMVEVCRARGLDVTNADARGYLSSVADDSLGGLIAVQVIEHLEPLTWRKRYRWLTTSCGPARASSSRRSTPHAGWRSLKALSATSRT